MSMGVYVNILYDRSLFKKKSGQSWIGFMLYVIFHLSIWPGCMNIKINDFYD
jgi:hypothetical protein